MLWASFGKAKLVSGGLPDTLSTLTGVYFLSAARPCLKRKCWTGPQNLLEGGSCFIVLQKNEEGEGLIPFTYHGFKWMIVFSY